MNICKNCKNETKNKHFCSTKCQFEFNYEERVCICGKKFIAKKTNNTIKTCGDKKCKVLSANKNRKETLLKKYGVEHQSQLPVVKQKIKQKRLEGAYDNMVNNQKRTLKERYGDENAFKFGSKLFKENLKNKYGNENYNNREKFISNLKTKYGMAIHPNTLDSLYKRLNANIIGFNSEKYKNFLLANGVLNVSQIPEIKNKKRKTRFMHVYQKIVTEYKAYVIPLFSENEYVGGGYDKLYKFKCVKCNSEFYHWIYSGIIPRCPTCYPKMSGKSKYQQEIYEYIKSIIPTETILQNDRKVLNGLELDIYIPNKNLAIEFDGLYFHSEISGKKDKKYHLAKTLRCEEHKIKLIHIFEDEWINKQNIVKKIIKHVLNIKTDRHIYARNCIIKEIDSTLKNKFLNQYHLQGEDKSNIKLGAFYNDELVAVMTFGKYRIAMGKHTRLNEYELSRYAFNTNITGIASKLITYFIKNYNPRKIITYADRRYFTGNVYEKIGFKRISTTSPSYWYTKDYTFREHRFNYRKNILKDKLKIFNPNMTEWENMQLNRYDRIWDCGNYKFEMNLNI